jgi:hypothetical protein
MYTTPVFGFTAPNADGTDPAYLLGQYLSAAMDRLEEVLRDYVTSPDVSSLNAEVTARAAADFALSNRLTPLEGRAQAQLYASAAQTGLPTGFATMTLDRETIDTAGGHTPDAGGSSYTVPAGRGGAWIISGAVAIGGVGTGVNSGVMVGCRVLINGAPQVGHPAISMPVSSSGGCEIPYPADLYTLAAGDVVTLQGYVNTSNWSTLGGTAAGASTSRLTLRQL